MIGEILSDNLWLLLLAQGTACLAAGMGASIALRRRAAHAHQVLLTALVAAALMPGLYLSARHFGFGVLAPPTAPPAQEVAEPPALDTALLDEVTVTESNDESALSAGVSPLAETGLSGVMTRQVPWSAVTLSCWLLASAALLLRLALRFLLGLHLLRTADPRGTELVGPALDQARRRLAIERPVRVRCSAKVHSPVIWCWARAPVLLLHRAAVEGPEGVDWTGVFCHELAHWRRRDHVSGLFAELLTALLPWHPLLWWAKGRLLALSEQACDDWVLATGQSGVDYAETLLGLAAQRQMAFLPTMIGKEKTMNTRIRRLFKDDGSNPRIGARWTLTVGALALCTTVGVAVAQRRPAAPERRDDPPSRELKVARDVDVRNERGAPRLVQQRTALKRLIEQLTTQAAEKKAALGESRDLSPEERQIRQIELRLLTEQIQQMQRRLDALGREPAMSREPRQRQRKELPAPDLNARLDSLRQAREDMAQKTQEVERRLQGLGDGQDQEARALKTQLDGLHARMARIDNQMEGLRRAQAKPEEVRGEQTAREPGPDQQPTVVRPEQMRMDRGEGDRPESRVRPDRPRGLREELRANGDTRAPQKRPGVTRGGPQIPDAGPGKTEVKVFQLRQANPQRARNALEQALGESAVVAVDERTGSLVVSTTPENMARAENMIRRLDAPASERGLEAEVKTLRDQMNGLNRQMQQMQRTLEQLAQKNTPEAPSRE
jgi:beta-lactamase regulating signal transducer with metallopeptidase domain/chaperonin cofactor prefoldin